MYILKNQYIDGMKDAYFISLKGEISITYKYRGFKLTPISAKIYKLVL